MTNSNPNSNLIDQVLQQPLLLQQLTNQVYQLLLNDLTLHRDRNPT